MFSQDGRIFSVEPQFIENPESDEFVTLYRNKLDGNYYFRLSTGIDVPISTFVGAIAGGELSGTYPNPSLVNSAVIGKVLTGLIIGGGIVTSADSILISIGKLQGQINMLLGGVTYQGTWDALTNNPLLVSSVGTKGYYYVVNVDGSTNLDGITDWLIGDWAIFNGLIWQKVDNTQFINAGGELSGTYPNPNLVNSAVIAKVLTGLSIAGSGIISSDSILQAFGKLQNQINGLVGGVTFQGTWNANTNVPALASSVGTKGYYYVVSVTGNTNLNGTTDWRVGDWAIFNGTIWEKVDNTDQRTIADLVNNPELFDDFIGRSVNWTPAAIGAGSSLNYNNALSGHPGNAFNKSYWSLNTSGANNSGGILTLSQLNAPSNTSQAVFLGQSTIKLESSYLMRVAGGIAFGVNGFASIFGLLNDNTAGTITNGIYVIADIQTVNANYVFRCTRAGITTSVITTVPIGNMVERICRVEVNGAGTQAQLFINDVLEATIITNIPLSTTILIGSFVCRRSNGAGGLACSTYIDWVSFKESFNTPKV